MIEILDMNDEKVFGLRLAGKFDNEELKRVFNGLVEKAQKVGKFKLFYEIADLDLSGFSREMVTEELRYLYSHPEMILNMEKVVLVSDHGWLNKIAAAEIALIPTMTGRTFSFDERDEALDWLKADQRSGKRVDVIFSELVELGTVKALGGFGLGLLTANLLVKRDRRRLGFLALTGSLALGLPLGVKILNNNRSLVCSGDVEAE